ncbi:Rne/Rng family ribonuclease [Paracoccus sp. R12_1]|uniref:ribonuclease E/G n=1 Tax=unclassified Paracoccus (in: a-proteobacteria) TaxID=2688777 RepID=UPI001ADCDA59|nr:MULTISPECIES: ribonuclease E/G [unclassified Paracoccus (in: a-proteobacteria)]MBO9454191.1 Rne/Rng family ribonuclease [Paracoccus sp. R12_2]MBO9484977.1 Rne/Rng family ribonuclease [Paracoccus sp. R12_1]
MAKKMLIDATHAEETRVVVVDGTKVEEFDFETLNKRQISGNIYLAKVTRVEPSLQAAFVDYGGNRHGFLAFAEIHPDYYQIPAADREALLAEERAHAEAQEAEENSGRGRRRSAPRAEKSETGDETVSAEAAPQDGDADGDTGSDAQGDAASKDDNIESVADEDVSEEIRPSRKPRARRYKIQEVVKVRQIMLVQVVKEERGNKGAALTTYLSLAGRYCVLMPNTARGGGISRKITNAADRKKLKDIAGELSVPKGAGLIIRTAGSQRTRTEIKRDYEYLLRLWEQIRDLTFKSVAPAPIYEEGDLIKRNIRDLYSKDIDEVLVEGDRGYRVAKDFMKMIMPSHARNVKNYADPMPLFARYQVESYLSGMFNPTVQLKSGGYIVIGVTEALVAIDVNSGRATKEGSIEETALKTNLEAADEVARQLRLRDLAGLIVIDFIDMEERKNNAAVEKRMKDRLKSDRARIQVGRISGFGLMEMSRQRLRPGMLESTTQPCAHCHGTGLIRSDDSLALTILRAVEEEGTRKRSREVLVRAPVAVANFLINSKREHIAGIELRYGMSVRIEGDPALISPDYTIEKFKTATRTVPDAAHPVLSVDAELMAQIDDEDVGDQDDDSDAAAPSEEATPDAATSKPAEADASPSNGDDDDAGRGRRRRRRRRRKSGDRGEDQNGDDTAAASDQSDGGEDEAEQAASGDTSDASTDADEKQPESGRKPRSRTRSRRRDSRQDTDRDTAAGALPDAVDLDDKGEETRADTLPGVNAGYPKAASTASDATPQAGADVAAEVRQPVAAQSDDAAHEPAPQADMQDAAADAVAAEDVAAQEAVERDEPAAAEPAPQLADAAAPVTDDRADEDGDQGRAPEMAEAEAAPEAQPEDDRPKRRGWWSLGR